MVGNTLPNIIDLESRYEIPFQSSKNTCLKIMNSEMQKSLLCKKKTNLQNALLFFDIYKLQRVFGLGRNFFEYAGGGGGKS